MKLFTALLFTSAFLQAAFAGTQPLNGKYDASDVIDDLPGTSPGCYNERNYGNESYYRRAGDLFPAHIRIYASSSRPLSEINFIDMQTKCEITVMSNDVSFKTSDLVRQGMNYTRVIMTMKSPQWHISNQGKCLADATTQQWREYHAKLGTLLGQRGYGKEVELDIEQLKNSPNFSVKNLKINNFNSASFCKGIASGYKYNGVYSSNF